MIPSLTGTETALAELAVGFTVMSTILFVRFRSHASKRLCAKAFACGMFAFPCFVAFLIAFPGKYAWTADICAHVRDHLGLPCESHDVETRDGYTVNLRRIPNTNGMPVLLLHGIADSSATFLLSNRDGSLGSMLHDDGFDVWLMDTRGKWPWKHNEHSPYSQAYWNFTFDDNIHHDLPAMTEFVLATSKFDRIAGLVGHSQGGMVALGFMVSEPEASRAIQSVVAMAPPLAGFHADNFIPFPLFQSLTFEWLHPGLVWTGLRAMAAGFCSLAPSVCQRLICVSSGCHSVHNILADQVPKIFQFYPSETSWKNIHHYMQCEKAGRLQKYDYGSEELNIRAYNRTTPPGYHFDHLAVPVAIYYGTEDKFVVPQRSQECVEALPKQVLETVRSELTYGHADFIWGQEAKENYYPEILGFLANAAKRGD